MSGGGSGIDMNAGGVVQDAPQISLTMENVASVFEHARVSFMKNMNVVMDQRLKAVAGYNRQTVLTLLAAIEFQSREIAVYRRLLFYIHSGLTNELYSDIVASLAAIEKDRNDSMAAATTANATAPTAAHTNSQG